VSMKYPNSLLATDLASRHAMFFNLTAQDA